MAKKEIKLKIKEGKDGAVGDAIAGLYPIPQLNKGTEKESVMEPEFTKNQWVTEYMRRHLIKQVARYEQQQAQVAVTYNEEDDLVE